MSDQARHNAEEAYGQLQQEIKREEKEITLNRSERALKYFEEKK